MNDPEDFAKFLAALPPQHETALTSDNVSTAYYLARRAGWDIDALAGDALATLARGGVGLVVTRLLSLSENAPVARPARKAARSDHVLPLPECGACGQPYQRWTRAATDSVCVACGYPLQLHQYEVGT